MLRAFVDQSGAEFLRDLVDVDSLQQLANRRRADVGKERVVAFVFRLLPEVEVFILGKKCVGFDRLARSVRILSVAVLRDRLLLAGIDNDVVRVVDDLLEITQRQIDEVSHRRRQRLEEPDMRDGYGELDVTHALATDAAQGDFDAAAIADHSTVANSLVFAAMAFPVLDGTEDPLAEQAVLLGLERAIVDGLGLQNLAPRPPGAETGHLQPLALLGILRTAHLIWRRDADLDVIERRCPRLARATKINH